MTSLQLGADTLLVTGLTFIGHWLGGINGINGFVDKCLTPFPMGAAGLCIAWVEWVLM